MQHILECRTKWRGTSTKSMNLSAFHFISLRKILLCVNSTHLHCDLVRSESVHVNNTHYMVDLSWFVDLSYCMNGCLCLCVCVCERASKRKRERVCVFVRLGEVEKCLCSKMRPNFSIIKTIICLKGSEHASMDWDKY